MSAYSPASLPLITSVEIVLLKWVEADQVDQYLANAGSAPRVVLHGRDAQRIAELWRALPSGEQARCHTPPYGLRFCAGERIVCNASICWECNNIFGEAEGQQLHFEFEAGHPTSAALLTELQRALPDSGQ